MSVPGTSTLNFIHFGLVASGLLVSFAGLLPIPFGIGLVIATVAGEAKAILTRKQTDQVNSM